MFFAVSVTKKSRPIDSIENATPVGVKQIANLLLAIKEKIAAVAVTPLPLPGQRAAGLRETEKGPSARHVKDAIDDRARVGDIVHETHHHRVIKALRQRIVEKIAKLERAALCDTVGPARGRARC